MITGQDIRVCILTDFGIFYPNITKVDVRNRSPSYVRTVGQEEYYDYDKDETEIEVLCVAATKGDKYFMDLLLNGKTTALKFEVNVGVEDILEYSFTSIDGYNMLDKGDGNYELRIDLRKYREDDQVIAEWNEETGQFDIERDYHTLDSLSELVDVTPNWLVKQLNIPFPFEMVEFDYEFCEWCGKKINKGTEHTDCQLKEIKL